MIREGIVKGKKNGMLEVCFERPEACEKCGACAGRAHTHLTQIKGEAEIGDRVAVDMPDAKVFRVSLLVYAVPLAGLVAGMLLGYYLLGTDTACALCGIALMAVSYLILHFIDKRVKRTGKYTPELVAVVPAGSNGTGQ